MSISEKTAENALISVIVPIYNIERYIERSAASILAQTHRKIELILVDDGSTDGSRAVIERIAASDSRVVPIFKSNGGVTSARLEGVRHATGEWIGFVDGDDYIEPTMYEHLLENAKKYHADISHCGYQMVFPSRVTYYYNTGRLAQQDKPTGLKDLLDGSFIEPGLWNKLFHKSLFHSLLHSGVMNMEIRHNEDLLMNFYLFREANLSIYEDICPYHYILNPQSATHAALNDHMLFDPMRVTDILLKETQNDPALHEIVERRKVGGLVSIASMNPKQAPELIKPKSRRALAELRQRFGEILKSPIYSSKLKGMALLAVINPRLYRGVHAVYAKIRGTDK